MDGMMGHGIIGSLGGFVITLLILLLVAGIIVLILSKTGYAVPRDNERIVKMEKDIEEIKKTVEEIKSKLEEI